MPDNAAILKELRTLRALGAEVVTRTSRLEEGLSSVKMRAPRKGLNEVEKAVLKRNKRILK